MPLRKLLKRPWKWLLESWPIVVNEKDHRMGPEYPQGKVPGHKGPPRRRNPTWTPVRAATHLLIPAGTCEATGLCGTEARSCRAICLNTGWVVYSCDPQFDHFTFKGLREAPRLVG